MTLWLDHFHSHWGGELVEVLRCREGEEEELLLRFSDGSEMTFTVSAPSGTLGRQLWQNIIDEFQRRRW